MEGGVAMFVHDIYVRLVGIAVAYLCAMQEDVVLLHNCKVNNHLWYGKYM